MGDLSRLLADVVSEKLRGDQELVGFLLGIGHEQTHAVRIDVAVGGGELANPQHVEHAIFETPAGRLLEDELGRSVGNKFSVDLRKITGAYHPDTCTLVRNIQTILGPQTVKSDPVVSADAEFIDLDGRGRELRTRNQEHG